MYTLKLSILIFCKRRLQLSEANVNLCLIIRRLAGITPASRRITLSTGAVPRRGPLTPVLVFSMSRIVRVSQVQR